MLSIPSTIPFKAICIGNGGARLNIQSADYVFDRNFDPISILAEQVTNGDQSTILLPIHCYRNFRALVDNAWDMSRGQLFSEGALDILYEGV